MMTQEDMLRQTVEGMRLDLSTWAVKIAGELAMGAVNDAAFYEAVKADHSAGERATPTLGLDAFVAAILTSLCARVKPPYDVPDWATGELRDLYGLYSSGDFRRYLTALIRLHWTEGDRWVWESCGAA